MHLAELRNRVADLVASSTVQRLIFAVIAINAVVMGLETSAAAMARYGPLLKAIDAACLAFFVVELAAKLFALGPRFFRNGWNVFDFAVVAVSLIPQSGGLSILRALRVFRVLRLVSALPQMRRVVEGLIDALPGMGTVFLMMSLIFYVAAVIATQSFGTDFPDWFGSVGASGYTLFQIMTLESWSMGIVRPVMEVYPYAWTFFLPFILVTTFAVANLVVGLIVNSMQDAVEEDEAAADERHEILNALRAMEDRLARIEERMGGK